MNPKIDSPLAGSCALVTGGAKRIGRRIVLHLARRGVEVVVHYHSSKEEARSLLEEVNRWGVSAWLIEADFAEDSAEELMARIEERGIELDFLINNAAIFPRSDLEDLNLAHIEESFKINAWAPFALLRAFARRVESGASVNLLDARVAGYDWEHVGYYLSKVLLERLTKMSALALAPDVRVNAVAPGLILPPPGGGEEYLEERLCRVPLGRSGNKAEVAGAVSFLLENQFVTGQTIYVDGGRHLLEEKGGESV